MRESKKHLESAVLAGGCFWCTEALFKRLKGVLSVVSGYSGGKVKNPYYERVSSGTTGHAEAIKITFDPKVIPYERILEVFWHTHNPTTPNKQGPDIGTQYRSLIFYNGDKQRKIAFASLKRIEKEGLYKEPIVTEILPLLDFYPAEDYHKDYYDRNKSDAYCTFVINPKIQKLIKEFGKNIKEEYK